MPRLFISYRREDSIAYAGRLDDHLSRHFGSDEVFMDIGKIPLGEDFVEVLEARIAGSEVIIALIGPAWLNARNERGRRIDQPDDFVACELAAAFAQGKRVIPVLVGGARMPESGELPARLARLARCQAHRVDDTRFGYDLDTLIRSIERRPSLLSQFVQLANAERTRKWRQVSAIGISAGMFLLGWVQIFDLFGIDARIESYTMALGDLFVAMPVSERIAIVSFDQRSESRLGPPGPAWRSEHAQLIDRLVAAGASVIAFDLFFEQPSAADAEFLAAIRRARQAGRQVFVGARQLRAGEPAMTAGLREAASGVGLLCIGGRIAYASIAPLAAVSRNPRGETASPRLIALGLLAAGATTLAVDPRRQQLTAISDLGQTLWQGPLEVVGTAVDASGEVASDCPLLTAGDQVAEAMLRLAPLAAWRDPSRRHDYEQWVGAANGAPGRLDGRIVLVGDARPGRDEFRVLHGLLPEMRHGVELHADVLNNVMQGVPVRRLGMLPQFFLMLFLAGAGGWLRVVRPATPAPVRRLWLLALVPAYLALTIVLYTSTGLLLNTAYHLGAFMLAYWLLGKLRFAAA
ncbi:MAG: CHASE2 domain-containing protein [Candidatus Accumulibacter sp. UW26]|jgi:hypothetical protein